MTDDDITAMFDRITPEDFFRETSAAVPDMAIADQNLLTGEGPFRIWTDSWIDWCISQCREGAYANFALLHNAKLDRIFRPDHDETPEDYARRLVRESQQMDAEWFFVCMLSPGRTYVAGQVPQPIDPTAEAISHAIADGQLEVGIFWTAIRMDATGHDRRAGVIHLDAEAKPVTSAEGRLDQHNPFYNVIGAPDAD